jgi:ElaB/YqjD/DUF883 family membrane-anchored ribosome-binding protein
MEDPPDPSVISRLKREIDELALQLELGKADAVDFVEERKDELRGLIDNVREAVDEGKVAGGEQVTSLKQSLDELRVQLALGRMETQDSLSAQRAKISAAVDSTRERLEPVEQSVREKIQDSGESLKTKLSALALDLGIRGAVAEEELSRKKDEFKSDLKNIKETLQPAIDGVGESLDEIGRQARDKFDDLKNRLNQLFD